MAHLKGNPVFLQTVVTALSSFSISCAELPHEPRRDADQRTASALTPSDSFAPVFITYFGGSNDELARDVGTDPQGNIYFAGSTASLNFPVTANGFDTSFNSLVSTRHDGYIAKVTASGQVVWSTYLGGKGFDRVYALEVDNAGQVYVAGRAGAGFPVTAGAFQVAFAGGDGGGYYGPQDGFVCKFRSDGARAFCSYFGDSDGLAIRDLAIDDAGDIYVAAATAVGGFPTSWFANAFQKSLRGGTDLIIAKIRGDGSNVLWATYLGGSSNEVSTPTVRVDAAKNVYIFSGTTSADLPIVNGFDNTLDGPSDGYVAKLSADGSRLLWSSYLGGSGKELNETHSMALDPFTGDVIVAAGTTSADFPVVSGVQGTFGGVGETSDTGAGTNYPGDAFIARIAADGSRLIGSTYLGGSDGDGAEGVWVDRTGAIYISGTTFSRDFPGTSAKNLGGRGDMFVALLSPDLRAQLLISRFGGTKLDVGRACFVDDAGVFYAVGDFKSGDLPTLNAFQSTYSGNLDAVLLKFAANR